jgi:hypothetical protein
MADLGFVAFRTPLGDPVAESCLMAVIHELPTHRHFDPERASFWVSRHGRGQLEFIDHSAPVPLERPVSWGRIRLVDRFGARNSFVGFGGMLTGERAAADALLLVFRSPAPILRLPSRSQQKDILAEDVIAFFGRLVPRLWSSPEAERMVADLAPLELYAAFLLHAREHLLQSPALRESADDEWLRVERELALLATYRADALARGRDVLADLRLGGTVRDFSPDF